MASASILRAARARIAAPVNWTQGAWARNAEGLDVDPSSASAVCWCAIGALEAACSFGTGRAEVNALRNAIAAVIPGDTGDVSYVNDRYDHPTVLALFDAAIEEAEACF